MASLDIINIPVTKTQTIFAEILKQNFVEPQTHNTLIRWYETITQQNYFTYNKNILIQKEGLATGAPSSGLIAEFLLQHIEHQHMARLSQKHKIINYFRYVDDILVIFDPNNSRNSPHFMEPEGSLTHSQVPATCPYPDPAWSST